MSKQLLGWHCECLKNMRSHLKGQEEAALRAQARLHQLQNDVEFYERQINEATKRGMDDFDRDRLLKTRVAVKEQ